jgi:hypothetical protein
VEQPQLLEPAFEQALEQPQLLEQTFEQAQLLEPAFEQALEPALEQPSLALPS